MCKKKKSLIRHQSPIRLRENKVALSFKENKNRAN